jgi:hypothetical protein
MLAVVFLILTSIQAYAGDIVVFNRQQKVANSPVLELSCATQLSPTSIFNRVQILAKNVEIESEDAVEIGVKFRKIGSVDLITEFIVLAEDNLKHTKTITGAPTESIKRYIRNDLFTLPSGISLNGQPTRDQKQKAVLNFKKAIESQQKLQSYLKFIKGKPANAEELFYLLELNQQAHSLIEDSMFPTEFRAFKFDVIADIFPHEKSLFLADLKRLESHLKNNSDLHKPANLATYNRLVDIAFTTVFLFSEVAEIVDTVDTIKPNVTTKRKSVELLSKIVTLLITKPNSHETIQRLVNNMLATHLDYFFSANDVIFSDRTSDGDLFLVINNSIESASAQALAEIGAL